MLERANYVKQIIQQTGGKITTRETKQLNIKPSRELDVETITGAGWQTGNKRNA